MLQPAAPLWHIARSRPMAHREGERVMIRGLEGRLVRCSQLGILVLAAGFGVSHTATGASAASRDASKSCASAPGVKPLIRGLVDRGVVPPAASLDASSVNVAWSDLEPSGPILAPNNPIDQAIAVPGCTPLRIRVIAGMSTPGWVLTDAGQVSVTNPYSNTVGVAGDFWTAKYRSDYNAFEKLLAQDYKNVPNIVEFVVSRCALFYPEPFILGTSIATNDQSLVDAGYTEAADQQCQQEEIDTAAVDWPTQRIGVSFNPYQVLNPSGATYTTSIDEPYTAQMMAFCRHKLGSRCVLENDSIRDPISGLGPSYAPMYSAMAALGAPIAFQTATATNIGNIQDFWGTLVWAHHMHASSVELPVDGTYPTTGGPGAPAWETLAHVAEWFE
jgi:hypothetical protein